MPWPPPGNRDPRAAKLLKSKLRVQAWLELPGHAWPAFSFFDGDIVETTVEYGPQTERRSAALIEFDASVTDFNDDWTADQGKLRQIVGRFRFLWLGLPQVVCARLIDIGNDTDSVIHVRVCQPAAVGAPGISFRAPLKGSPLLQSPLLSKALRPEVDRALQWYLAAIETHDPFVESAFMWMAIEALAPAVRRAVRCGTCDIDLPPCKQCNTSTPREAVVASITAYLGKMLDMPKKEVSALYDWRSKLMHGKQDRAFPKYKEAAGHAKAVREVVNQVIAKEMDTRGSGAKILDHPDHLTIDLDACFKVERREGVLDEPFPLFKDLSVEIPWPHAAGDTD